MPDKFKVGIIGHTGRGDYGHGFDVCWRQLDNVDIVGLADPHEGGRAAAQKRTGAATTYADYREMMDKEKPDIVSICTRHPDQHREMFLAAAERGIHAYMEKPMCATPAEADDMVAAAEKHKVKLALGYVTRYSPLLDVVSGFNHGWRHRRRARVSNARQEDSRRGGGEDLMVLGSHLMNLIHVLGGDPEWCFSKVLQDGVPVTKEHVKPGAEDLGPLAGDNVHAVFGLEGGRIATFDSVRGAGTGRPWRFAMQIMGSKGIIEIQTGYLPPTAILQDASWCPALSGKKWQTITSAGVGKPEPFDGDYRLEGNVVACRDLIQAIRDDRQPECDVRQGRMVIEMINAVFDSHRRGGQVEFPLETRGECFGLTLMEALKYSSN